MALFKFRKGGDEPTAPPTAAESVQAMRKRARHRLMGAAVLVLAGVIGFPLLFDNQPRPIAVDVPINIPDRNKVKPLGNLPVTPPTAQSSGMIEESAPPAPSASATTVAVPEVTKPVVEPPKPVAAAPEPAKPVAKAESKPTEKAPEKAPEKIITEKATDKPVAKVDDAAKAKALLEGRESDKPPAAASAVAGRFVVQVGAFADVAKAREARMKLERAGLKTYTQVVQAKEGKRIRVRVGPFESKAQADKAVEKVKKLDLPAALLEL